MALQVWLPLNGNLNNQGLEPSSFIKRGSKGWSKGKVTEKCFGNSSQTTSSTATDCIYTVTTHKWTKNFSVAFWASLPPYDPAYPGYIFTEGRADAGDYGFGVRMYSSGVSCCFGNLVLTIQIPSKDSTYNWHHISMVVDDNSKMTVYLDGIENTSGTPSVLPTYTTDTGLCIGCFYYNNSFIYQILGFVNDFRLYDHCLSQKEIKELSKGLCLHYKLSNQYEMNVKNLYSGETAKGSDSYRSGIIKTQNPDGSYKYILNYTGVGSNYWPAICFPAFNFTANKKYLYSVKVKCNSTTGNFTFNFRPSRCNNDYAACKDNVLVNDGKWHEYYYVQTIPSTLSGTASTTPSPRLEFYTSNLNGNGTSYKFDIDIKDCLITETDNYIPFIDNSMTSNSVTDCSGYGNDGTISGTLTYSNDTPRYEGSSYLTDSESCIKSGDLSKISPSGIFTFNIWFKKLTGIWSSKTWETILGGPSGFEIESKLGSTTNNYIHPYNWGGGNVSTPNSYSIPYNLDTWNMLTMVRTASDTKFYLNGELKVTGTAGTIPSGDYFLGAWRDSVSQNYRGILSDARIYATALSAEDVKALYNTPISIDNHKNLHCMEIEQTNNQTSFCKSGVAKMELLPIPTITEKCAGNNYTKQLKIWANGSQLKLNDVHKIRVIFRSRGDGTPTSSKCSSIGCIMYESSWKWSVNPIWWSSTAAYNNIGKIIDYTGSLTVNSTMTSTTTNIPILLFWIIQNGWANGNDNQTHDLYYYKYWNATTGEVYAESGTPEYDRITTNDFMEV